MLSISSRSFTENRNSTCCLPSVTVISDNAASACHDSDYCLDWIGISCQPQCNRFRIKIVLLRYSLGTFCPVVS